FPCTGILSLHDALPIFSDGGDAVGNGYAGDRGLLVKGIVSNRPHGQSGEGGRNRDRPACTEAIANGDSAAVMDVRKSIRFSRRGDRKSTRLNSSHVKIS